LRWRELVDAVRADDDSNYLNVARKDRIDIVNIGDIELLNPDVESAR